MMEFINKSYNVIFWLALMLGHQNCFGDLVNQIAMQIKEAKIKLMYTSLVKNIEILKITCIKINGILLSLTKFCNLQKIISYKVCCSVKK